jgi:ribosomal protein S18 acetylase RimI-like enzyme
MTQYINKDAVVSEILSKTMNTHEETLKIARNLIDKDPSLKDWVVSKFPELKESEDERIRKRIIEFLSTPFVKKGMSEGALSTWLAWLEKQGKQKPIIEGTFVDVDEVRENFMQEVYRVLDADSTNDRANQIIDAFDHLPTITIQKPTDKVEPKFNVNDWITSDKTHEDYRVCKILKIENGEHAIESIYGYKGHNNFETVEKDYHLWTIQDAKDGDVLFHSDSASNGIFIFKKIVQRGSMQEVICHCDYDSEDHFCLGERHTCCWVDAKILHPATKEQRDFLFQKMKEAGYEWDAEKKELKKIEEKPEIKDDVLSRFAFYQYDDDAIYLSSLFVRESDRGHGYGSKVLKAAEEVAKTFGISKIRLKVERNTWMEKWYKKNGYEYLSSEGKYDWLENRVIDIKPDKIEQSPVWSEEDENSLKQRCGT